MIIQPANPNSDNKPLRMLHFLCRLVLALPFIVFGLNGFIQFIPVPELHPFLQMMLESGYLSFVKAVEITGGLLLVFYPLHRFGMLLLGPVIVNIAAYHIFLDPRNSLIVWILVIPFGALLFLDKNEWWHLIKPNQLTKGASE